MIKKLSILAMLIASLMSIAGPASAATYTARVEGRYYASGTATYDNTTRMLKLCATNSQIRLTTAWANVVMSDWSIRTNLLKFTTTQAPHSVSQCKVRSVDPVGILLPPNPVKVAGLQVCISQLRESALGTYTDVHCSPYVGVS